MTPPVTDSPETRLVSHRPAPQGRTVGILGPEAETRFQMCPRRWAGTSPKQAQWPCGPGPASTHLC